MTPVDPNVRPDVDRGGDASADRHRWLVLLVVLLGLAVRVYYIGHQSIWGDEGFSLTVSRLSWRDMSDQLIRDFVHPPLHYFSLHAWFSVFGFGAVQSRMLSACFGTLAVPVAYWLARYLFDARTGLLSAGLLAVSQLAVMYSQEARPYAQLLFFVLCATYCFVVALRERRIVPWCGFVLSTVLMMYTHYHGALVVLSLLLYAAIRRRRYSLPVSWWIGGGIVAGLLYAPWLASGIIEQALHSPKTLPTELPPWFSTNASTIFSILITFNNSRAAGVLNSAPLWAVAAGGLLLTVPVCAALALLTRPAVGARDVTQRESIIFLLILFLLPVLLVLGISARGVQFDVRYIAFCAVPYYMLAARGITTLPNKDVRRLVSVLVIAYSGYSLRANYYVPYKENYRDAFAYVAQERRPGDCWLFLPFEQQTEPIWSVYHEGQAALPATTLADAIANADACPRLWVLEYRRASADLAAQGVRTLEATHARVDEKDYFWIHLGLYRPRDGTDRESRPR